MTISKEVWNVGIISVVMMLLYATCSAGFDMLNASLADSSTTSLDAKVGYLCSSIYCFLSIGGSFIAPFLFFINSRFVIFCSSMLYVPFYIGVIFLNKIAILCGSAITGIGDGVVWVAVYGYVVRISRRQNLERNMSYFIFIYSFAALIGNLINYFNMEDATKISDSTRIHIFSIFSILAIFAGLLALFGLKKMPPSDIVNNASLSSDSASRGLLDNGSDVEEGLFDEQEQSTESTDANILQHQEHFKRLRKFISAPATIAQIATSLVSSICDCWVVIICTCIRNTYSNRHLIPIFGIIFGCCKVILGGTWNKMSKVLGYKLMICITSTISLLWLTLIFIMFPSESLHSQSSQFDALVPLGSWAVFLLGLLTGVSRTWMDLLKQISCGTCSKSDEVMQGFQPSLLFSVKTIFWSSTSAIIYALVPYISLYVMVTLTFIGLAANHFVFIHIILRFFLTE